MRKLSLIVFALLIFSCTNSKNKDQDKNKVYLSAGKLNTAKLTDTLVINESTCKGCDSEYSTHFDVSDSLGIVTLERIQTTDNNDSSKEQGATVKKDLFLVPVKTGKTQIKLYRYYGTRATAQDSMRFTVYNVEIKK